MKKRPAVLRRADIRIRLSCRRLTGKQRIILVGVASLLFTIACLYSIISSISRLGGPGTETRPDRLPSIGVRRENTTNIHPNIQKHENGLSENQGMAGAVE